MAALPTDALTLLEAANAADASADAVETLIDALALILADVTRDENRLA